VQVTINSSPVDFVYDQFGRAVTPHAKSSGFCKELTVPNATYSTHDILGTNGRKVRIISKAEFEGTDDNQQRGYTGTYDRLYTGAFAIAPDDRTVVAGFTVNQVEAEPSLWLGKCKLEASVC